MGTRVPYCTQPRPVEDSSASWDTEIERGHLVDVANEQEAVADGRMVPGLTFDRRHTEDLLVALRRGTDERQLAPFGQHEDVAAGQHDLSVAVAAALPLEVAGRGVD